MIYPSPKEHYAERLALYNEEIQILERKNRNFEIVRFLIFFGGVAGVILLILAKSGLYPLAVILFIVLYLVAINRHAILKKHLGEKNRKRKVNLLELKALEGDFSQFENGSAYLDPEHGYSSDLDLFGEKSIFQYFNRTLSPKGSEKFSSWFLKPENSDKVLSRQLSIKELSENPIWIEDFRSVEISEKVQKAYLSSFFKWLGESTEIYFSAWLRLFIRFSPWFMGLFFLIFLVQANFTEFTSIHNFIIWRLSDFLVPWFLLNLLISGLFTKRVNLIHQKLSGQAPTLLAYSEMIAQVEKAKFINQELISIQNCISHNTGQKELVSISMVEPGPTQDEIKQNLTASSELKNLSKILNEFDRRMNVLASLFTNGIYLSDLRLVLKLDVWKNLNKTKPTLWIEAISEMEALVSLAIIAFNERDWIFPSISLIKNSLKAQSMGHPLIPQGKRISNPININPPIQVLLVTGSNMAGKSTYLRTIGVNLVLAQMGSKVCAGEFSFSPVALYTSLRITDSLQENTSSFYAELKRLEILVKRTKNGETIFFLLDEILRGTNSNDRHLGSRAVIKHLIQNKSYGVLATHDLSLGEMEKVYPKELVNMHFDVSVKNDELFFDYTLKSGICTSLNASILMRKIGLDT